MKKKTSKGLIGVAGEYAVAAELCRRGVLASITLRAAEGVDIIATNLTTMKSVSIQVKANQKNSKNWVLNEKAEKISSDHFIYIFVNLGKALRHSEFHIVPSMVVSKYLTKDHQNYLKTPGKKGQVRKDSTVRKFSDKEGKYLNRWDLLGLGISD